MRQNVVATALLVLAGGILPARGVRADVAMNGCVELPHAGVVLAVPKGFSLQHLRESHDVMRAVLTEKRRAIQAVSASAFAVGPKETAESFAEKMRAEMQKSLVIRELKVRKKTPMTVAGLSGSAWLLSYTYRGVATVAARVFFLRDLPKAKVRVCYVLTVESAIEREDKLLPVLGEMIKTFKLIDVRRPVSLGIEDLGLPWPDARHGYAVRIPRGWYAALTKVGLQMAMTDYLAGGEPSLTATVAVLPAQAGATARSCAAGAVALATKAAAGQNRLTTVAAQSAAKLGGVDGWQFVLRQVPKKTGNGDLPVFIVHRLVCRPAAGKGKTPVSYSLILICQGGHEKRAVGMMEKIADGYRFLAPPASTQPGGGRKGQRK